MNNMPNLINQLKEIQKGLTFTNLQMAEKIGCSSQLYRDTKSGNIPLGITVVKGAFKAFPQTAKAVLFFLSDGADITAQLAEINTNTPQTHQDKILRALWGRVKGLVKSCLLRV